MFVGIGIEFNDNGTITLSMNDYVKECIELYCDKVNKSAVTPASSELFHDTKEGARLLVEEDANKFHYTTAKLLYLSKRVRIDIDLVVSYLCTRIAQPNMDDKAKLIRVLSYLRWFCPLKFRNFLTKSVRRSVP